jgi:hypothetical protein
MLMVEDKNATHRHLARIGKRTGLTMSDLIREGIDHVLDKYRDYLKDEPAPSVATAAWIKPDDGPWGEITNEQLDVLTAMAKSLIKNQPKETILAQFKDEAPTPVPQLEFPFMAEPQIDPVAAQEVIEAAKVTGFHAESGMVVPSAIGINWVESDKPRKISLEEAANLAKIIADPIQEPAPSNFDQISAEEWQKADPMSMIAQVTGTEKWANLVAEAQAVAERSTEQPQQPNQ